MGITMSTEQGKTQVRLTVGRNPDVSLIVGRLSGNGLLRDSGEALALQEQCITLLDSGQIGVEQTPNALIFEVSKSPHAQLFEGKPDALSSQDRKDDTVTDSFLKLALVVQFSKLVVTDRPTFNAIKLNVLGFLIVSGNTVTVRPYVK